MTIVQRIGEVSIVTPAGTTIDAPDVSTPYFGDMLLDHVEVRIPPGHNGVTGIVILNNDIAIAPWGNPPTYLVDNDRTFDFPIGTEIDTALSVWSFNDGVYDHTFYLRFFYTPITLVSAGAAIPTIVSVS